MEFVDYSTSYMGSNKKVKVQWYEQPTNGISYVRIKVDLRSLPPELRLFVPLFRELLPNIGTKNYTAAQFNDKMLASTNGLEVSIDKFAIVEDDVNDRHEQLLL